jgi:hypothetical protein
VAAADLLSDGSDLIFAGGALYVCCRGFNGYQLEWRARRTGDPGRQATLQSDARLEYARISLQHPLILAILMLAAAMKIVALALKWG